MEVVITASPEAAGAHAADIIEVLVREHHEARLGLATGSSPLVIYGELIRRHGAGRIRFDGVTAFMLDDYLGLPSGHPQSYRTYLEREFTDAVGIGRVQLKGPDVQRADVACACDDYEELVVSPAVDLQLLGIGSDGHIGFNEPSSSLRSRTRIKTLTRQTRHDNARFFSAPDDVPRHVITQGIGTILQARHIVLIACGESKAVPVARAVEGPLTARFPASAIQLHPHTTVVIDEAGASALELADYYRDVYRSKPEWQRP